MHDLIQDEIRAVVTRWKRGEAIDSILIGHSVRVTENGVERHNFRQKQTHAFVFALLEGFLVEAPIPDHLTFDKVAQERAREFQLTAEEQGAGQSLAWVALHRGWKRAIAGFPDHHSITVKREAQA